MQTYKHTYITLHYISFHVITLHYITLNYTTLHYTALHYITLHYTTLQYTTVHYITLHYITYIHYTALHYTALHYIGLHYITLHYITYIHTYIHYTALHYTALHYIGVHYITYMPMCFFCWLQRKDRITSIGKTVRVSTALYTEFRKRGIPMARWWCSPWVSGIRSDTLIVHRIFRWLFTKICRCFYRHVAILAKLHR